MLTALTLLSLTVAIVSVCGVLINLADRYGERRWAAFFGVLAVVSSISFILCLFIIDQEAKIYSDYVIKTISNDIGTKVYDNGGRPVNITAFSLRDRTITTDDGVFYATSITVVKSGFTVNIRTGKHQYEFLIYKKDPPVIKYESSDEAGLRK